jgi:protein dithiol oxidoreductase (disulfide-forming)
MKRVFAIFCLSFMVPLTACAADADLNVAATDIQAGTDYAVLPTAVPTADPSKIEVVEVFWYGCIHCFSLEPTIQTWKAALQEDVEFVGMPAIWAEVMELHAKMFYANQVLGLEDQLHQAIFDEMNTGRKNQLPTEQAILDFVEDQGVDPESYRRAMNSFGVNSQVQQAKSRMGAYQIRSTPQMVVNGKYVLTTQGGHARMLQVASALIEMEREALAN